MLLMKEIKMIKYMKIFKNKYLKVKGNKLKYY